MTIITIIEGMHNPFSVRDEVPLSPNEVGQPLGNDWTAYYQEADWFAKDGDLGQALTAYSLVYDGQAPLATPEPSTWLMLVLGLGAIAMVKHRRRAR